MRSAIVTVAVFLTAGIALTALAELKPGDKAPDFDLFGTDYKYHAMADYPKAKAFVLVFTCNHCPVAKAYEDKLVELGNTYQAKGVQFLAINTNPADMVPADSFPNMIKRAAEKKFPFPYLYDERQEVAAAYGATNTPHVFVVSPKGVLLYEGSVDNRHKEPEYLSDALDAVLEGREIEKNSTAQFGCTIKWRKKAKEAKE